MGCSHTILEILEASNLKPIAIGEGISILYISSLGELDNRCKTSLILNYTYVEVTNIDEIGEID